VSVSVYGLQLGKHRGAAVVGQALNIAVQATTDNADDLAPGCLDADVFYADNRVDKSRVRITVEKSSGNAQDALIRIRATAVVDEPVVTIYLRTGCTQKIEKRYVVLADVLSESAAGAAVALPSLPAQAGAARPLVPTDSAGAASTARAVARNEQRLERAARLLERKNQLAAERADKAAKAAQVDSGASISRAISASAEKAAASSGSLPALKTERKANAAPPKASVAEKSTSRLKLEAIEPLSERDPALKTTGELRTTPTTDPAQRSAAAALWRAIAAQPEDILGDSQKLKSLESAVAGLQVQMKKNELEMRNIGGNIDKAQAEKYANPLVYLLSVLLFLAAVRLALTLRKRSGGGSDHLMVQPWWRRSSSQRIGWADSAENLQSSPPAHAPARASAVSSRANQDARVSEHYLDLDLSDDGSKSPRQVVRASRAGESLMLTPDGKRRASSADEPISSARADFMQSASSGGRAVKAEELFDVQQQADFFVSLGQKDQAIEVLRSHIEESEETSALVYLDLLKLYHQQGEQLEFEAFRQEFNARFNGEMPEFDEYSEAATGEGLQAYPLAMSRIVALWPSAKVVSVIEESMFRQPDLQTAAFDLEAYRELLLLYAMIKDILHAESAGKGPTLIAAPQRTSYRQPTGVGQGGSHAATLLEQPDSSFPRTSVVPLTAMPETLATNKATTTDGDVNVDVDLDSLAGMDAIKPGATKAKAGFATGLTASVSLQPIAPKNPPDGNGMPGAHLENSIDFDFDQPATANIRPKKQPGR
jgi:hypothetical protein